MPTVIANGITLGYEQRGSGPPLVLIMGLGADRSRWEDHVAAFEERFTCLLVDNRGAGESDAPAGSYTTAQMARDVAGLMAALGVPRAHVAGISMGSAIAQELALAYPAAVRSLVLISSWARCDDYMRTLFEHFEHLRRFAPLPDFMTAIQLAIYAPAYFNAHLLEMRQGQADAVQSPMPVEAFAGQCHACTSHDTLARLSQIEQPTLITVGAEDIFTPLWCAAELEAGLPDAVLDIFTGTGHAHHWEMLDEFNDRVLDFLLSQPEEEY